MSVNKAILLGNLGKDPELRYTANQTPICSFSVATSDRRKDANGQWVEQTEWHNIVTFGKTAENCANFLKKGRQAFIEGKIQTRKWQDKEGKDRYTTEILANTVQFIGGARDGGSRGAAAPEGMSPDNNTPTPSMPKLASADAVAANGGGEPAFDDDDIPF